MLMKSEIEVTKIFTKYIAVAVIRYSFNLYRKEKSEQREIVVPMLELNLLSESLAVQWRKELTLNLEQIKRLEIFIQNPILSDAISHLSNYQKLILYLKYFCAYSNSDISRILGNTSRRNIGRQFHRMLGDLKQEMD